MPINDGSIIVGIKGDTSDIERKISELQRKLRSLRETGPGGTYSQLSQQYRNAGQEEKAKRLEDFRQRVDAQNRQAITRSLRDEETALNKMMKQYQAIDSLIEKQLVGGKAKVKVLERQAELMDQIKQKSDMLQRAGREGIGPSAPPPPPGGGGGGGGGGVPPDGGPSGFAGLLGRAATRMAGIGGALLGIGRVGQAYGDLSYMQAELPARQAGRELGIAKGTTQLRERAIRGENFEDIIFAPERAKAIEQTMDFFKEADEARLTRARSKAAFGVGTTLVGGGLGVAGGMAAGAKLGGLMGTAVGPLGTAVGGILGGIGGAAGAAMGFFGGSEEAYYGLTGNRAELSKMTGREAMQNYETFKFMQRMKDPTKYYQKKMLAENQRKFLALQRSGGMTDEEMFGKVGGPLGYIQRGSEDFLLQERMGMSQQIVGAGGSGYGATQGNLHLLALQAQRSMGLTNAGQAMGRLSGYMNEVESKEAFINILSKGVSIGLDESEFREQNKDYLEQVTAIANKIGGGEDLIAATIAAGVEGDISRRGIAMSGEAFERLENALNEQGGITGAARAGLISENERFQNIQGMDRIAFQNLKMSDIREDNPVMKMYYKKATGKDADKNPDDFAAFINERQDVQRKALFQTFKGTELDISDLYKKGQQRNLLPEEIAEFQEKLKLIVPGFAGLSAEEMRRTTKAFSGAERIEEQTKAKRERLAQLQKQNSLSIGEMREMDELKKLDIEGGLKNLPYSIDKINQARSKQEAKQYEGLEKNMEQIFKDVTSNLDQTLAQQIEMESFNKALLSGAGAVRAFLDVLEGKKPKPKPKPVSKKEAAANSGKALLNLGGL